MKIILAVLLLVSIPSAYAGEVSLVPKPVVKEKAAQFEPDINGFDQMQEFVHLENEKIKDIKLLNLDLERASLVLRKKEIEAKLARLNKSQGVFVLPADSSVRSKPLVRLAGIFMTGTNREALLNVNGTYVQVREGQSVPDGEMVKKINPDTVTLEGRDGKHTVIQLDS